MSRKDLLHMVFKRKWQMLIYSVLSTCIVGLLYYVFIHTYVAYAGLLVKTGKENVYVPALPGGGTGLVLYVDQERLVNSEMEILTGRDLAEEVVNALRPEVIYPVLDPDATGLRPALRRGIAAVSSLFGLSPRPPFETAVNWFQDDLTVEVPEKSNVLSVSFSNEDAKMAATVVNKVLGFYFDRHVAVHRSPQTDGFFQSQSRNTRTELDLAEARLERFKNDSEVTSLDEERTLLLSQEAGLRAAVNQTESEQADTQKRLEEHRQQLAGTPASIPTGEETEHNPALIRNLQEKLADLRLKEHQVVTNYAEQSRQVQQIRGEIQILETTLAELKSGRYGKNSTGLNSIYQMVQQKVLDDEALLKGLTAKRDTQLAQLKDLQKKLGRLNQIEKEFNRLKQEVAVARDNYKLYMLKTEEARVFHAMDTEKLSNVSLIEPARPPLEPILGVLLSSLLILVTGVLLGVGLTLVLEYTDNSLETPEDVEGHLGVPVLASIPALRAVDGHPAGWRMTESTKPMGREG